METAADGAGLPAEDTATPPARVAMETTKLLVGGGGDPVTSSAGASRDYGGAQQLSTPVQRDDDDKCTVGELRQLMTLRGDDCVRAIREQYGGVDELCRRLHTDPHHGLHVESEDDLVRRRRQFGSNTVPAKRSRMFLYFVWEATQDLTLIVLIIAALVSFGLSFYEPPHSDQNVSDPTERTSGAVESLVIMFAVVLIVLVSALINWTKDLQFRGLQQQLDKQLKCLVVRNGDMTQVLSSDVVVGDICIIKYGDVIAADGVLTSGSDLRVDESSHTGESDDVDKSPDTDPALYCGTRVVEGIGKMVVTAVGVNSVKGVIISLLGLTYNSEEEPAEKRSVLHQKLVHITLLITYAGTMAALLTFVVLVVQFCVETFVERGLPWHAAYLQDIVGYVTVSITILVVAVPEGLPLAVVLALAYSIKQMMRDNNLVRHLDACETMGNATTICCDKTGTLTANKMTVVHSYVAGRMQCGMAEMSRVPADVAQLVATAISVNSSYTTSVQVSSTGSNDVGSRTECALLSYVLTCLGHDYQHIRLANPESSFRKLYTFNSDRKYMATVVLRPQSPDGAARDDASYRLYVKGAAEVIVARCDWLVGEDGSVTQLTDALRTTMTTVVNDMSTRGLRTIAVAFRDFVSDESGRHSYEASVDVGREPDWTNEADVIQHLVCLAVLGIEDPVRAQVPAAIAQCQAAGISVRLVTGDALSTAKFVAYKCGILHAERDDQHQLALEGRQFNKLIRPQPGQPVSQSMADDVWPRLRVLARCSPEDKYNLVRAIMDSRINNEREIVAVTGDGTNDGPALRKAHVGLAMGVSGTDVAKEASDIILLDDNFASIVKSVMWGRHVYDSIAKFLQFQLTVNVVAVTLALLAALIVHDTPLKGVQMLWVNLLMDSLASLSLATERPSADLLRRSPYKFSQPLVSTTMSWHIVSHYVYQLAVLLALLFAGDVLLDVQSGRDADYRATPTVHYTFVFNTFVMMILCNELCARRLDMSVNVFSELHHSSFFIVIWLTSLVTQVVIIQFGGTVFFTVALTLEQWLWSLLFGIGDLLYAQLVNVLTASLHVLFVTKSCKTASDASSYSSLKSSPKSSCSDTKNLTAPPPRHEQHQHVASSFDNKSFDLNQNEPAAE